MAASGWTLVDASLPAFTHTYSFGPGIANALALVVGGGVVVVSPPYQAADRVFSELEAHGPVRALVAPNAFHTMGLAEWKARHPDAPVFAPAQSIARVEKRTKIQGIQLLSAMGALLGDRVQVVDMPHYKTGEALVRWKTDDGWAWFLTDVAMNFTQHLPGMFGVVFRWTKSAPGLRRNALAGAFQIKDKRALYGWLVEQAEATPPRLLVMCHGDHHKPSDPVAEVRAAFR